MTSISSRVLLRRVLWGVLILGVSFACFIGAAYFCFQRHPGGAGIDDPSALQRELDRYPPAAFLGASVCLSALAIWRERSAGWRAQPASRVPDELAELVTAIGEAPALRTWFLGLRDLTPEARGAALQLVSAGMIEGAEDRRLIAAVAALGKPATYDAVYRTVIEHYGS